VCCSVLQCVAVCCSVLQCVAVCCSALQYTRHFCVLQCAAVCCSIHVTFVCCSVLQCVAVCCSIPVSFDIYDNSYHVQFYRTHTHQQECTSNKSRFHQIGFLSSTMGWLRLVGSLKLYVSFAEYSLFYRALLQTRPIILRSLLIIATPCMSRLTRMGWLRLLGSFKL